VIRTTNNQSAVHVLDDLQRVSASLQHTQRKLSTGKEINQVEDDPVGAGRAMHLRSEVSDVQQYQKNINEALGFQDASESAMSSVQDILKRAKELVVQAGNGTLDQTGLNNIAAEIKQLVEAARQSMNGTYAGRYLFSGTATLTPPFPSPALTYAGDDNTMQRVIGQGEQVDLNLRGWEAFSVPPTASGQNVLQLLDKVATDLQAGNRAALGGPDLQGVDAMLDQLSASRAQVGARTNRLETQQSRLKDLELNVEDLLSKTEDADMAKAMVDFSMQQSIYQSALQSGARVLQPSLLDFLR
jgi:flagellar hook-associated protein 3 FlgL